MLALVKAIKDNLEERNKYKYRILLFFSLWYMYTYYSLDPMEYFILFPGCQC